MCLTEFDEKKYEQVVRNDERIFLTFEYVQDGDLDIEKAAKKLGLSVPDFERAMTEAGYKLPDLA